MLIRPRRSVLYMPGANKRALEKAQTLPADALILDLEDSVAPAAKAAARDQVCGVTRERVYANREVVVRINALDTPWGADDLAAVCRAGPDAILVPKISSSADVADVFARMGSLGGQHIDLWLMIETPRAVLEIGAIAQLRKHIPKLATFVIGANDLAKETRAALSPGRAVILPWLSQIVLGARAYGLDVIDSVYNDHADIEGFRAECAQARELGMDGKSLIHPSQITPCNEIFSPSAAEIAWARKISAAFDSPENERLGVISVDGKMIERLHLDMAQRILGLVAIQGDEVKSRT
ncbi:MAG: CoA ester lyase [Beijerinckiaceae bacterium]|nr:CoA ester lyase [Beijerinckiaceae bacterium]